MKLAKALIELKEALNRQGEPESIDICIALILELGVNCDVTIDKKDVDSFINGNITKTITLWVDNRKDGEIKKDYSEILSEFMESDFYRDMKEKDLYLRNQLINFIAFKEGINASFEQNAFENLYEYARMDLKDKNLR